jgi:hypothetical protein
MPAVTTAGRLASHLAGSANPNACGKESRCLTS